MAGCRGSLLAHLGVAVATFGTCGAASATELLPDGAWSVAERDAVAAAWARLPAAIRDRAPRSVMRDVVTCDPEGWPDDDALIDGAGRAHLCPRPGATAAEVGRQVAVALLIGFDRASGWSADPAWRRHNGWRTSIAAGFRARPENTSPAGFASPRGRRSPRWDLATFTAALLLDPAGADGGIGCRLLSQTDFVRRRLGRDAPAQGRCDAFEDWADLDRLAGVEVVLAAPSTAMVGSLFGHLFLRLVYRDEDGQTPLHLSQTIAFLADNDVPFDADPTYALKGIAGYYSAALHQRSFLDTYREYVVLEGRDLRRWRLNLTAPERRALLERIWTVAHSAQYAYYFFRRNCATLMVDLVDDVLPPAPSVAAPGVLATPPASTLEPWERRPGADGRPLLEFVAEPILSFDHLARLTSRHRTSIEPRLAAGLSAGPAASLAAVLKDAHDPAADLRASAYARLAILLADGRAGTAADVHAWLRDATAIESYLSTLANEQAEARDEHRRRQRIRTAIDDLGQGLRADAVKLRGGGEAGDPALRVEAALRDVDAPDPARRLDGYRALSDLAPGLSQPEMSARLRLLALLVSESRYDVARMKAVPGLRDALLFVDLEKPIDEQPYLAGREDLVRAPVETRVAPPLRALQRSKQALFAARDLGSVSDPIAAPELGATARREYDASLTRSGIDQAAVLGGLAVGDGRASTAAGLVLDGALYDERLGDHRHFGFPSDTALVVARSSVLLAIADGAPVVAAYDARAFGYRSLRLPLPEAGGARRPLGWETYVDLQGSRARDLDAEVKVGWGLLAQIAERGELADHLLLGLDLAYEGYFPSSAATSGRRPQALAAPLSLELRAGLGAEPRYRSWLAARTWLEPIAPFAGAPLGLQDELGLAAEAHLALRARSAASAHDPALLIRSQISRTSLTFTGVRSTIEAFFALGIELR